MSDTPIVTQRQLAARLGVSQPAVSMALAGDPRISKDMRDRILAMAEQLGYRPDPGLRSLARYRRSARPANFQSTLAWVHSMNSAEAWRGSAVYLDFNDIAARRAERIGYKLENFWIPPAELSDGRASQILASRGVRGLLLMPQAEAHHRYDFEWTRFSAVRVLDYSQDNPRLHVVASDHYANTNLVIDQDLACGYHRPALVTTRALEERLFQNTSAAFLAQHTARRADWPSIYWNDAPDPAGFARWLKTERPDVLLLGYSVETYLNILAWLRDTPPELRPDHCMLCLPDRQHHTIDLPDFAGVDECWTDLAERSVDMLAHLLEHFDAGIPALPRRHLMQGRWHEGTTLRLPPPPAAPPALIR